MVAANITSLTTGDDPIAQVFRALGCAIAVLDERGTIVAANDRWHQDIGDRGRIGAQYLDSQRQAEAQDLDLVLAEGVERVLAGRTDRFELEHPIEGPLGRRWHLVLATPYEGGAVVVHVDVTAHHDVRDILDARAHRDPLTGLPNRLAITERLRNAINRSRHQGTEVAVVFLDLNGFKAVNDLLGHDVGDELLAAVGRRFGGTIRADDTLGRWGGDEFVVVVEGGDEHAVRALAERLHDALVRPVAIRDQQVVDLGVAVGASTVRPGDNPDDVLSRADLAMFEAKRTGRPLVFATGAAGVDR